MKYANQASLSQSSLTSDSCKQGGKWKYHSETHLIEAGLPPVSKGQGGRCLQTIHSHKTRAPRKYLVFQVAATPGGRGFVFIMCDMKFSVWGYIRIMRLQELYVPSRGNYRRVWGKSSDVYEEKCGMNPSTLVLQGLCHLSLHCLLSPDFK